MAITTLDQLINGFIPAINFYKTALTAEGAGTYTSYWAASGYPGTGFPGPIFSAGIGYTCSGNTMGAFQLPTYPQGEGQKMYLARFGAGLANAGHVILYDRLWHCTGFSMNSAAVQSITTPGTLPPRCVDHTSSGLGTEAWGYIIGVPGATAGSWSINYTNSDGVPSRTGLYSHPANAETVNQALPFTLQCADKGVQSIQSITTNTSATAGNLGLMIIRRLAETSCNTAGVGFYHDAFSLGMPEICSGTCLGLINFASSTIAGVTVGSLVLATG